MSAETTGAEKAPDAEKAKISDNGAEQLPIGSREDFTKASPQLEEKVIAIPELGFSVKVRALTAGQDAMIRQISLDQTKGSFELAWAEMEIAQFQAAVVEPQFRKDDVRQFHNSWPAAAFARVTNWVDAVAGKDKEELRRAREEFQRSDKQ